MQRMTRALLRADRRPSSGLRRSLLWLIVGVALAAGLRGVPARAEDNADQNVYVDYLAGSWDDWSFNANRAWNASDHVHSFSHAGKISFTQAYGALRLHFRGFDTRAFDTTGFSDLQFAINWGGAPQDKMLLYALRNENFNKTTKLQLSKYLSADPDAPEDGWYVANVPLADLGVANVTDLTDILFSGPTPKTPFWIDDIKMVKPAGPRRIVLNVDAGMPLRTLDGRHLGINTAAWDPLIADPSTIAAVQASGARFFRFPGGTWADTYHWTKSSRGSASVGADTTAFMKLVKAADGQAILTVNYSTGTPEEAAAWVQFCNVTHDYDVKYWEIGNENYQSSEPGSHDPLVYAQRFGQFYTAMKAVDPTIKIGVQGTFSNLKSPPSGKAPGPGEGDTGTEFNAWGPTVLKALAAAKITPDFYSIHYFPTVAWSGTPHEDDADLLQYSHDWATIVPIVRDMLNSDLGAAGAGVEIMVTENSSVSGKPGKQSVSLVNGLYMADSLGQALGTEIAGFMWWDLHNGFEPKNNNSEMLYGFRNFGDYGLLASSSGPTTMPNTPYPTFYALQLFSEVAGSGSKLISSTSNNELLPVYASLRPDGSLAMLVINKNSQKQLAATINVAGFQASHVKVDQFGAFQDYVGSGPTSYSLALAGSPFVFVFPSYSMTVLTLQP